MSQLPPENNLSSPSLDDIEKEELLRMQQLRNEGALVKSRFSKIDSLLAGLGSLFDSLLWKLCEDEVREDKEYEAKRQQRQQNNQLKK